MTQIDSVAASALLQAHTADLQKASEGAKAAVPSTPAISDPDHDGDSDGGGVDADHGTDIRA